MVKQDWLRKDIGGSALFFVSGVNNWNQVLGRETLKAPGNTCPGKGGGGGFGRGIPALGIHGMDLDFRRDFRVQKRVGLGKLFGFLMTR